ncbi:MAG: hypothetical protein ACFE9Y_09090 [Promethearchaeota archaeon]
MKHDYFINTKDKFSTKKYQESMITVNENYQNLEENNQIFQLRGFCITKVNIGGKIEIFFQKGIGITLTVKIIDLYKDLIFEKRQGYIKDTIGSLNVYMHFFEIEENNKTIMTYIDKIENPMKYNDLYQFSKRLYKCMTTNLSKIEIEQICTKAIKIPKAEGIVGIFVIDKAGFLYFSKINKNRQNMANNNFQIAGFISAILIYSQDFIAREEYGLKLEDIDLGGYRMFLKTKNNVIFAYIVNNDNHTDNLKRYMHLVMEEFMDKYYHSHVVEFNGDLSPFHSFEQVIDLYFKI